MNPCAYFCKKYVNFQKVFRLFTPQFRYVWTSPHAKNDHWIRAHIFVKIRYLPKSTSMVYPSISTRMNFSGRKNWSVNPCASFCKNTLFLKKYFDCLPLGFDSYDLLRTLKMISESVRIFLQKTVFSKTYFDCLPLNSDTYELLRTLKMIS